MVIGGFVYINYFNSGQPILSQLHPLKLLIGGILVGIGTWMSNGCPSGHGICGNATANKDSIVVTTVFLIVAIIVAQLSTFVL